MTPDASSRPISVYIHVPFCTVKCAYCDFNSYAGMEEQIPAWESALLRELAGWSAVVAGRPAPTVFLGGGTPSLLAGETVTRLLDAVRANFALTPDAEITLEANPESVSAERMAAYRAAGVNRVSMGVQSLHADELAFLDRLHSAERAREAFDIVRAAGFDNVNVDLIFGLPGQPESRWRETLDGVLAWEPDHLSCYALTVEEGTPLALRVARGEVAAPDPDVAAAMAEWTEQRLGSAGYAQYEISNYARPGRECRHNLVYWRHEEYVGVGPGAHGFVDGVRYAVERAPLRYTRLMADAPAVAGVATPAATSVERVPARDAAVDAFVMGMRLNAGIDVEAFRDAHAEAWASFGPALAWAAEAGLTAEEKGRLRLTQRGRRLANELFVLLF